MLQTTYWINQMNMLSISVSFEIAQCVKICTHYRQRSNNVKWHDINFQSKNHMGILWLVEFCTIWFTSLFSKGQNSEYFPPQFGGYIKLTQVNFSINFYCREKVVTDYGVPFFAIVVCWLQKKVQCYAGTLLE